MEQALDRLLGRVKFDVRAFAGSAEPGVCAVGLLLGFGFVASLIGREYVRAGALVGLVGQDEQPGGGQRPDEAPDPGRGQVVDRAAQRSRHP